jgi:hypothetical protein
LALTLNPIFVDRFRGAVGIVSEVEPKFGLGSREVSRWMRFALSFDFECVLMLERR